MIDSLLTIPAKVHWDVEIVSILFNVVTIGIGLYIAIGLNKKIGIATRQKEMLYKYMDKFSEYLNDIERDIRNGTIEFDKAISIPYSVQTKLFSLQKIIGNAYGKKASKFDSSVTKLIGLLYILVEQLDESNLDNQRKYSYDSNQIFALEKTISDCSNMFLEMQIDINKM